MLTADGRHRYEEIDSLRGLAAMVVVMTHACEFWEPPFAHWRVLFNESPLGLLLSGSDAVYLFFVISGFVLFLPYLRVEGVDSYGHYVIKRVCRIYLPYAVALVLAILADVMFYRALQPRFNAWHCWYRPIPLIAVRDHFFLIWHEGWEFNPAFWTLTQEMRISFLFPLIALMVRRPPIWLSGPLALAICAEGFYLSEGNSEFRTIGYVGVFMFGAVVARYLPQIRTFMEARGWFARSMIFVFGVFLFKATHLLPPAYYRWFTLVPLHGAGATVLMILALTTVYFKRFLHTTAMLWLGKVSYSLYLLHGIILYSLVSVFWNKTDHRKLLVAGGVVLSLVAADGFYRWVERPAILLGRRLTRRKTAVAAVPATV